MNITLATAWRPRGEWERFMKNLPLLRTAYQFDMLSGRSYNRRIVIRDGVRKEKPFFIRMYNPTEIRQALRQAGLEIEQIYGDWEGAPIGPDSRRMIVIARKRTR